MTIGVQTFYFPLPRFGVKLSEQWDEFRHNFNSLAPIVRAAEVDISNTAGQSDLSYLDVGELDFRNRFRIGYDKTNDRFVVEYNNGTEISPNWVPYLAIRQGDGRVIALGPGGFQADGGFYNLNTSGFYLWVRESVGKRFTFDEGEAGVVFDAQYFYIARTSNSKEAFVSLTPAGVSGEVNTASNLGAGEGVFSQKVGVDLRFKSLVAGSNITLSSDANQITINSTASGGSTPQFYGVNVGETDGTPVYSRIQNLKFESANFYVTQNNDSDTAIIGFRGTSSGGGETNTASNLGAGTGVFAQKSGVDLQFKSLVAGSNISLSATSTQITVNAASSEFYGINVGETDNTPVYKRINTLKFENQFFYVTQNDTDTAIVSFRPATGSGEANTASNLGSGAGVFAQKVGVDLQFKSLVAGTNISFSPTANDITINASGSGSGGGFYGVIFKESKSGGRIERDDTLVFDSNYFYLSQAGNDGKPFLSFIPSSASGETNTASNLGVGEGIFAQKSGVDLQFKSLVAGSNISLTPNGTSITVASSGGSGGGGGFYGVIFKESESGGRVERDDTLVFDSRYFYLSTAGGGKPILSFRNLEPPLATYNVTNVASIDINSVITGEYPFYDIYLRLVPVTDDVILYARTSADNGNNFDSAADSYWQTVDCVNESGADTNSGARTEIQFCSDAAGKSVSSDAGRGGIFVKIEVMNLGYNNMRACLNWSYSLIDTGPLVHIGYGTGFRNSAVPINAIRFFFESGNIASGTVSVYGRG